MTEAAEWRECWCCGDLLYWDPEADPPRWIHPEAEGEQ